MTYENDPRVLAARKARIDARNAHLEAEKAYFRGDGQQTQAEALGASLRLWDEAKENLDKTINFVGMELTNL